MSGILFGVGVGPGDPEEMTLKAVRILKEADILILPEAPRETSISYRIASAAVPELAGKPYLALSIPMSYDRSRQKEAYDQAAGQIARYLEEGRSAAYITIGDPAVYSSFAELDGRIRAKGYETRMISGVPSFCACAAALGIPLVKGDEELRVIPGNLPEGKTPAVTEVYMKSGRHLKELKQSLQKRSSMNTIQAAAVSACGGPDQKIFRTIEEMPDHAGYMTTVIVKEIKQGHD